MCRLIGIVASEPTRFSVLLREAPRSLATLSREHPDGWGIAAHCGNAHGAWLVHRGTERAERDDRFHHTAIHCHGRVLVAHVRKRTVGSIRLANTHPFTRDGWVFAHNGTVEDQDALRAGASKTRLSEVEGDTDSELLFAHLLTRLDEAGLTALANENARAAATTVLAAATERLREKRIGAFNFLLSDGTTCFAHRYGRTMFVLERGLSDRNGPGSQRGAAASWTPRRVATFVASEAITNEPWREIPEGTFLRVDRQRDPQRAGEENEPGRHRAAS